MIKAVVFDLVLFAERKSMAVDCLADERGWRSYA
jgi:hypothetical protein